MQVERSASDVHLIQKTKKLPFRFTDPKWLYVANTFGLMIFGLATIMVSLIYSGSITIYNVNLGYKVSNKPIAGFVSFKNRTFFPAIRSIELCKSCRMNITNEIMTTLPTDEAVCSFQT